MSSPKPGHWRPWNGGGTSQAKTYLRCASRWYFEKVLGIEQKTSDAMSKGSRLHAAWEIYLLTGELATVGRVYVTQHNEDTPETHPPLTADEVEIFLSTLHRLPSPPIARELVERNFQDLETYAPARVRSTIDLLGPDPVRLPDGRDALLVIDHKSTSSLKWALLGTEIRLDFQASCFVVEARRATGWDGPILFQLIYATTRRPFASETREYLFEPGEIAECEIFVRGTLRAMLAAAKLPVGKVPYNATACDDYKSKANPEGCPHRARCAALGRPIDVGFSLESMLLALDKTGDLMSDPLADMLTAGGAAVPVDHLTAMLAAAGTPVPLTIRLDPAIVANRARLKLLRPAVTVADSQLEQALKIAEAEQTRLIVEITTLDPTIASDEGRAMLRTRSLERLANHRQNISRPKDPATMDRAAVEAELVAMLPQLAGHFAGKPDAGLIALLLSERAERATAGGTINSPEQIAPQGPPDTASAAEAGQQAPAKPAKSGQRGARLPAEYGGGLVSTTTKKSQHLQRFLTDNRVAVPTGSGSTGKMRELALRVLVGDRPVALLAPTATAPAKAADPAGDAFRACIAEIRRLSAQVGITPAANLDQWEDEPVINELGRLRTLAVQVGTAPTATPMAMPAPPAPSFVPPPPTPPATVATVTTTAPTPPEVGVLRGEKPNDSAGLRSVDTFPAFVLFIDCHPSAVPAIDLVTVLGPLYRAVEEAAGVSHYLAIGYNDGPKKAAALLAKQVAAGAIKLPAHVYVASGGPSGPAMIEALSPFASEVVRGHR